MAVQARVYVAEVKRQSYAKEQVQVTMQVVSRGEENKEWAAATPSGTISLGVMNPAAAQQFVEAFDSGREFLVTFEPAPADQ